MGVCGWKIMRKGVYGSTGMGVWEYVNESMGESGNMEKPWNSYLPVHAKHMYVYISVPCSP